MSYTNRFHKLVSDAMHDGFAVAKDFFNPSETIQLSQELDEHPDFQVDQHLKSEYGMDDDIAVSPFESPLFAAIVDDFDVVFNAFTGKNLNHIVNRYYGLGGPIAPPHIDTNFKVGYLLGVRSAPVDMTFWDNNLQPHHHNLQPSDVYVMRTSNKMDPHDPIACVIHLRINDEQKEESWDSVGRDQVVHTKVVPELFVPKDGRVWHSIDAAYGDTVSVLLGRDDRY